MRIVRTSRGALVAVVVAVIVIAGAAAGARAWLSRPGDLPRVPASSESVHAKAQAIYTRIAGTPSQRAASGGLNVWAQNAALDRCMAAEGYPDWGNFRPIWQHDRDPLLAGTWLAEPHRLVLSASAIPQMRAVDFDVEQNNEEIGPAEDAAITDCISRTTHASERHAIRISQPRDSGALRRAWDQMIFDYATAGHDPDRYVDCLIEADVPGVDSSLLREHGLETAADGIVPPRGAIPRSPDDPRAESEEWQDFLEAERVVTDADWRCRADVYAERIDGMMSLIEEFEAERAEQIEQTEAEWALIEDRAARHLG